MANLVQLLEVNRTAIQAAAAKAAVLARRRDGSLENDRAAEEEFRRLLRLIEKSSGAVIDSVKSDPLSRISSEEWNRYQDALLVDLRTLYDLIGTIDTTSKQMDQVASSDLATTKMGILRAINRLRVHEFLKEYPEYQDLKIIDFVRSVNESRRFPKAQVDGDVRMLELPVKVRDVVSLAKTANRTTLASTNHYGGGVAGGFGPDFGPEKAIDPNPKTFWAEVVSHSGPIQTKVKCSWGEMEATGVVGEFIIELGHAVRVNNLKLLPFSEFPYNIIDIAYQDSPSSNEWMTLPGFSLYQNTDDWIEVDFPNIVLSKLKVMIEQPNYTRSTYNLPRSLIHNEAIWAQIQENVYSKEIHELDLSSAEEGLVKVQPEQLAYLSALSLIDSRARKISIGGESNDVYRDIANIIGSESVATDVIAENVSNNVTEPALLDPAKQDKKNVQIVKYEYLYGIRQLELSLLTYEPVGYYESPALDIRGNVISAELETEERHVEFEDGLGPYRRTSIEYEIEVAPGVRFPIVPLSDIDGANYVVRDEYLVLRDGRAKLRFTPKAGSIQVRKNGVRISTGAVIAIGRDITITNPVRGSVYTASYHVEDASTIAQIDGSINSTRLLTPETFLTTDKDNSITLRYYPYIVYEIVRDQNHWTKLDDGVAEWDWKPEFFPISQGTLELTNGDATVTLTKGDPTDPDFDDLIDDAAFENKIYIVATGEVLDIGSITSTTELELADLYDGDSASGLQYIAGRTLTHDGKVWGLNTRRYEPIKVFVDGERAYNITDYLNFEIPVFSGEAVNNRIEFTHSGRSLWFNQPIQGKSIQVVYSWVCQYLKVNAVLRSNIPVSTTLTPKVDNLRVRIKNTTL